jgi:hypothetical protein
MFEITEAMNILFASQLPPFHIVFISVSFLFQSTRLWNYLARIYAREPTRFSTSVSNKINPNIKMDHNDNLRECLAQADLNFERTLKKLMADDGLFYDKNFPNRPIGPRYEACKCSDGNEFYLRDILTYRMVKIKDTTGPEKSMYDIIVSAGAKEC